MTEQLTDVRWWPEDSTRIPEGYDPSAQVMSRAKSIATRQIWRRTADEHHLRLFSVSEWRGAYGIDRRTTRKEAPNTATKKLSLNVVRNCVNAATSMITRSRPYVSFQTDGADYRLLCLSRKRERFVQSVLIREKAHQVSQHRVRNGCIFGTGGTAVYRDGNGGVHLENILPGEILVDEQEGINQDPPCIYRAKLVDKLHLAAMFPEHKDKILNAPAASSQWGADSATQVLCVYAWHFRSSDGEKYRGRIKHDGIEVLCIDGCTLYAREYRWKKFPGTFWRWEEDPFGFFGTGIPAELQGIQFEINALLRMIQDNCYYGGNLKAFVQKGSKVALSHLSNTAKVPIIEYVGAPPVIQPNDVATPQIFQHLQYLENKAYSVTGISQLDAQSQTPFASMSGKARLVHQNSESLRFKPAVERYENSFIELAERILEAATDEARENGDAFVTFRGLEHLEQIKLSDIALEEDEAQLDIQAWSSSQLSQDPATRMQQADYLVTNGYIDRRRALRMMEITDIRSETDLANAPYDIVDERIARILYDGDFVPPSTLMDLDYALMRVQQEILRSEIRKGMPQEALDALREWREQVVDLQNRANPPAPPPAQVPAAPPGAVMPDAGPQAMQGAPPPPSPMAA